MVGNSGGADNNISVNFDNTANAATTLKDISVRDPNSGKKLDPAEESQSGAGAFYPVKGMTTSNAGQNSSTGPAPGGRPEGGPARQQGGGASM